LENLLSNETKERKAFAITLDDSSKATFVEEQSQTNGKAEINIDYLTRRLNELMKILFWQELSERSTYHKLKKNIGNDKLKEHYSFISFSTL